MLEQKLASDNHLDVIARVVQPSPAKVKASLNKRGFVRPHSSPTNLFLRIIHSQCG